MARADAIGSNPFSFWAFEVVLTHTTPQSGSWDESVLAAMTQAGVGLIPTLTLWRYELRHEGISLADGLEETAVGQLRAWVRARGEVLFGTDIGYMTAYDPTEEYALMTKAGMTFPRILASLTTAPAERFGASKQLGRFAPGFAADLTILRNDPSKDIRALAAVEYTIRDGKVIYRRRDDRAEQIQSQAGDPNVRQLEPDCHLAP